MNGMHRSFAGIPREICVLEVHEIGGNFPCRLLKHLEISVLPLKVWRFRQFSGDCANGLLHY